MAHQTRDIPASLLVGHGAVSPRGETACRVGHIVLRGPLLKLGAILQIFPRKICVREFALARPRLPSNACSAGFPSCRTSHLWVRFGGVPKRVLRQP